MVHCFPRHCRCRNRRQHRGWPVGRRCRRWHIFFLSCTDSLLTLFLCLFDLIQQCLFAGCCSLHCCSVDYFTIYYCTLLSFFVVPCHSHSSCSRRKILFSYLLYICFFFTVLILMSLLNPFATHCLSSSGRHYSFYSYWHAYHSSAYCWKLASTSFLSFNKFGALWFSRRNGIILWLINNNWFKERKALQTVVQWGTMSASWSVLHTAADASVIRSPLSHSSIAARAIAIVRTLCIRCRA